jgi:inositol-phosphate transport system ATP-binding protein
MARIELDRVSKRWGDDFALEPTSLVIEDGEFVAVLGPSGCGKTTTLLLLAGIYQPSSGEIRFDGAPVNEVEAKDRNVGIVFQSYALYPHMTVRQNILFPLRFKHAAAAEKDRRLAEAAGLVQIESLLDRLPSQLSGGQQQRVALARALVKAPQLLLLDEPLSNLDASLRLAMRSEIRRLQRRTGVTTILVTHDQIEATTMADRIVCMRHGRIEQIGTADELYGRPASLFVASFIGAPPINLIAGRAENGAFQADRLALAVEGEAQGDAVLGVRPEAVRLGEGPLSGVVEAVEPMGRETLYVLDTPLGTLRALEAGAQRGFGQGDRLQLGFAESDTLLFDAASERRLSARVRLAS